MNSIENSPYFSLMGDETTDKSTRSHLAVSARYIKDGDPVVSFVKDIEIPNGASETVFSKITPTVDDCGGFQKTSGFGSDGAAVMVGESTGVSTRSQEKYSKVIAIHCHNHRLALAAKDSYKGIPSLQKFDENIKALYKYYKNSAVRSTSLAEGQNVFIKGEIYKAEERKLHKMAFPPWCH